MLRDHHKWFSRSLNRDMELLMFGHAGPPVMVFPTSMGAFFEYEDRGMIGALADKLEHGGLRLFCLSSVDSESWYCKKIHPRHRVERHLHFEDYVLNEAVPLVKHLTRHDADRRHGLQLRRLSRHVAGAAASVHLHVVRDDGRRVRRVAVPRRLLRRGLLFPQPAVVPAGPGEAYYLDQFRRNKWVLVTGDHDICRAPNEQFSALLHAKGIQHSLHVWNDSKHDWPYWLPMAQAYLP